MRGKQKRANILVYLALVIVVIVVVVLVFGRAYQKPPPVITPTPVDSQIEKLKQQSTSDEILAITQDLEDTNLEKIDIELADIDSTVSDL